MCIASPQPYGLETHILAGDNDEIAESAHMPNNTITRKTVKFPHTDVDILKTMHICDVLDKHPGPACIGMFENGKSNSIGETTFFHIFFSISRIQRVR